MLSAFFSGTELALMSLAEHKIDSLYKSRKFWSKSLKKIKENNDRLLITILIGNNLLNTFTRSFFPIPSPVSITSICIKFCF